MNPQRKTALALMIILSAFALLITVNLARLDRHESGSGVLAEKSTFSQLKVQAKNEPKNQELLARVRAEDLRQRLEYFRIRRQNTFGIYLLIAAVIGFLMSANFFFTTAAPLLPDPATLNQALPREVGEARARRAALSIAAVTLLVLGTLAARGITHAGEMPPYQTLLAQAAATTHTQVALAPDKAVVSDPGGPAATPASASTPAVKVVAAATVAAHPALTPAPPAPAGTPAPVTLVTPNPNSPYKENWPGLRGSVNLGQAGPGDWPTTWSLKTKLNVAWSTEVTTTGKSSPIVWGDRIFLTGGTKDEHNLYCFDRATGKPLWSTPFKSSAAATKLEVMEDTGVAASTPVTDGKLVYTIFATGLLAAVDFTGKPIWTRDLGLPDSQYGFASSLLLHDNTLILQFDQGSDAADKKSRLIGFDPATGNPRWSTARPVPGSWASPSIIKTPARFELITCANPWVIAYDPAGGQELWRVTGLAGDVAPSPAFDGQRVFVANAGAVGLAIRPGGSGDVTATHIAWKVEDGMPDISSPVSDGKRVLYAGSSGTLTCMDAATGKKLWEKTLETMFSASPVVAGKYVYLCGQDGVTRVLELADTFQLEASGDVGEPIHVTPAFADGRIYIRAARHLFCIGAKP